MRTAKIFCALLLMAGLALPVDAAKDEWADRDYDWAEAKSAVFVYDTADDVKDGMTERMTAQIFEQTLAKKAGKKKMLLYMEEKADREEPVPVVEAPANAAVVRVGTEWRSTAPAAPKTPEEALTIDVILTEYRMEEVYHEGYYHTVSVPHTEYFRGPDGKQHERKYYTEEQVYEQPYYEKIAHVTLCGEARDNVSGQIVWQYQDSRSKSYGRSNNHSPQKMYARTADDLIDAYIKLVQDAGKAKKG